jgi:peptidylprolyl isomerase
MKVARALTITLWVGLVLAGCGGSEGSSGQQQQQPERPPERPPGPIQTQSAAEAAKRPEPEVIVPEKLPEKKLVVKDLIKGSGRAIKAGDEITVHFANYHMNGEQFESYWDEPVLYDLGPVPRLQYTPGWGKGLPGMRVGGRRKLILHPDLLFVGGSAPLGATAEKWTLVYVVDLLGIKKTQKQ